MKVNFDLDIDIGESTQDAGETTRRRNDRIPSILPGAWQPVSS